jgi:hypothetical protein
LIVDNSPVERHLLKGMLSELKFAGIFSEPYMRVNG